MHYIGLLSGTSIDAIDAVLASIGAEPPLRVRATHSHPIPPEIRDAIAALTQDGASEIDRAGVLDMAVGELFADAALALLENAGIAAKDVRAIGSHGQTIRHRPDAIKPFTFQIGNPSVIAERTGITTVADFRARDIAAGGQGAPLAPAFHAWAFASSSAPRAIINIGGMANITILPPQDTSQVLGFDTGPGNTLLDQWIKRHRHLDCDEDGAWAASGRVNEHLLAACLGDAYFALAPPKSTGREHFNLNWLDRLLANGFARLSAVDVQATLVALTAQSICDAMNRYAPETAEVFVCGGGYRNATLRKALAARVGGRRVASTEALGIPSDWVEACLFAWLARRTLAGEPGNLPSVTGARRAVVLGGVYPS